ncbi:hypothetical protein EZ428_09260 [Pedobacter frigiditerrae]|uniref:HNH endonuclease n=1 Tax=Pedobacter frigiditerrae TaxID=2530452 RepID=A0A4V2MIW2_9SPHI|nr:hypothetical protein [Pedobacter frigiditerrae]TCC91926.1 hypothetical protein EZ428_09260 [Pedobacter frigiditerrae]
MQKKNSCFLCGKVGNLTFEHIPPQCAFNNKSIYIQGHDHLIDEKNYLFGKKSLSNRGFGKHCLCASCNNSTGNWYAKDFCAFTQQGLKILEQTTDPHLSSGSYTIKPLNVIKQILLMFVCTDSTGTLNNHKGVKDYLLDKNSTVFPEKINIHIYSNACSTKRMIGYSYASDMRIGGIYKWSEINFKPFGYFLTHDSPPPNEFMVDITDFSKKPYDYLCAVNLTIARLKVSNLALGHYDNVPVD